MSPSVQAAHLFSSRALTADRLIPSRAGRSRPGGGTSLSSVSTGRRSSTTTCSASCISMSPATSGSSSGSMTDYVELHSHSNYSFLDGGSHPYELAIRAAELEMPALAITDQGGVYGAVRHLQACRKLGV